MAESSRRGVSMNSPGWSLGAHWMVGNRLLPHPARLYALMMGVVYTGLGISGFFRASGLRNRFFWGTNFWINGPHDVYHLAIGLLGLAAYRFGREFQYARLMSWLFSLLSVAGFLSQPLFGLLSLNGGDIFLHGVTALVGDAVCRIEVDEAEYEEIETLRAEVEEGAGRSG
jgi:hypothetical protein